MKTSVGIPMKVSSVRSLSEVSTVQGLVGEKPVEVLRDTGCSGVIVSKDLVPENAYTGRSQTMVMVDCSSRAVPEVKVSIETPTLYIDFKIQCRIKITLTSRPIGTRILW